MRAEWDAGSEVSALKEMDEIDRASRENDFNYRSDRYHIALKDISIDRIGRARPTHMGAARRLEFTC